MITTRASELVEHMARLVDRLEQDIDREDARQPAFSEIRELRRSLNTLEQELRGETVSTIGDAC
jgi:hypothetical protein